MKAYYDLDKQVGIDNTVLNSMLSNCVLFFLQQPLFLCLSGFSSLWNPKWAISWLKRLFGPKNRIKSRSCYSWSEFCHWLQKCYNFPLWNLNSLPGESCVCFPWIPNSVSSEILSIRECCRKSTGEEMEHLVLAETHLSGRLKWKAKFRE